MAKRESTDLRRWAVLGAEARLLQIAEEAAQIFAVFPELRAPGRGFMADESSGVDEEPGEGRKRKRRRRTMSPEARKRISEAQKARWREKRKQR